jgi:hypothetical protein
MLEALRRRGKTVGAARSRKRHGGISRRVEFLTGGLESQDTLLDDGRVVSLLESLCCTLCSAPSLSCASPSLFCTPSLTGGLESEDTLLDDTCPLTGRTSRASRQNLLNTQLPEYHTTPIPTR